MRRITGGLCVWAVVCALAPGAQGPDIQPQVGARTDRFGDPLPKYALARLGSARPRQDDDVTALAFSPDGKLLASCEPHRLAVWDVATARVLRLHSEPHFSKLRAVCFSPDGKWLAVGGWRWLTVYDAATGKLRASVRHDDFQTHALHFTSDGATLAAVGLETLLLWDIGTDRKIPAPLDLKGYPEATALAPDGKALLTLDTGNVLSRWRLADGKLLERQAPAEPQHVKCAALSADGKRLVVWPFGGKLHVRPLGAVKPFPMPPQSLGLASVRLTPDGELLLLVQGRHWTLCRAETGAVLRKGPLWHGDEFVIAVSADGKTLAYGDNRVRLIDLATGADRYEDPRAAPVGRVFFARDGVTAATVSWQIRREVSPDPRGLLWDDDGRVTGRLPGVEVLFRQGYVTQPPEFGMHYDIRPQGDLWATPLGRDALTLWDLRSGKEVRVLRCPDAAGYPTQAFSADGTLIAGAFHAPQPAHKQDRATEPVRVGVWEVATGKLLRTQQAVAAPMVHALGLSPSGETVVLGSNDGSVQGILFLDMRTGKTWNAQATRGADGVRFAFSPNGHQVAVHAPNSLHVVEVATGARIHARPAAVQLPGGPVASFSHDGRRLFFAHGVTVFVLNAFTGEHLGRLEGHLAPVNCLALARDGRRLLTGDRRCALLWDVTAVPGVPRPNQPPSDAEIRQLGATLASPDARAAHRAVDALLAAPDGTLAWLREHLRPAKALDKGVVTQHLAGLGAKEFRVRDKAQAELRKLGDPVLPFLEQQLQASNSLEVKRRLEILLAELKAQGPTPEDRRGLRAVIVLEYLGSPAARQFLQTLAGGAPEALLTREARAALRRLQAAGS
jgi:WD40 repeat protein